MSEKSVLFIDSRVAGYENLIAGLGANKVSHQLIKGANALSGAASNVSITRSDPANLLAAYPLLEPTIKAAVAYLDQFLVFRGTLDVLINVETTSTGRFAGGGGIAFRETVNSTSIWEASYLAESRTGIDPLPQESDVTILIDPASSYLAGLWWDPNIATSLSANPPNDQTDAFTVVLHEILHGLGIVGWRDIETGALPGNYASVWDSLVRVESGTAYWTGASTAALLSGASLEVRLGGTQGAFHIGAGPTLAASTQPWIESSNLNGYYYYRGERYALGRLELALLEDLGWTLENTNLVEVVNRWDDRLAPLYLVGYDVNEQMVGDNLDDRIEGRGGNDLLVGLDGKDTLFGGSGDDRLQGSGGDDFIDGGASTDTAVFLGDRSAYVVTFDEPTSTYTFVSSNEGNDRVTAVERFEFANITVDADALLENSAPIVSLFSPADGAIDVDVASNIVLTFNEAIARGTGTIEIRSGSATGALVESFNAANSSQLTVSGNQLTIDPSSNLAAGTLYFVVLASGTVRDIVGNAYAGTSAYDFTTATPVNSAPTGKVTIAGTATQGDTLTATNTLADSDGLGTISYQWNANGTAITGATGSTYTLTQAQVGKTITVTANYTDGNGTAERVTSSATVAVTAAGVNTITGDSRSNTLLSTVGDDVIDGGAGIDTVSYTKAIAAVSVTLVSNAAQNTGGAGIDTLLNIENLTGSSYNDVLTGNAAANRLTGGAGKDTLTGNAGNDVLTGGAGNDILIGGEGNDTLIGGAGKDVLTGGAGKDVFKFNTRTESGLSSTQRDVITDFLRGQDKIDLSTIDANTALAGNQAFTGLIGANVAFSQAGQLRLDAGVLYGNTDADATAEFAIALTGITTLANTDLVL